MKTLPFIIAILISFFSLAQTTKEEREKEFILSNFISDIGVCSSCSKESFLHGADVVFQTSVVEISPKYTLNRKAMKNEEYISDSIDYNIQFYKIHGDNWVGDLYVIHIVDELSRDIDVWIRVKGWRENDMRFLYLMYKKNGLKKRDFKHMVLSWCSIDSIAGEVPWDKIVKGAMSNKMEDDCFISEHYKLLDSLRYRDGLKTPTCDLYSVFSRQPMSGMWMEY